MKKIILFIGAFLFISIPAFAGSFPDVPEDHANYEAVEFLDERGIIHGYGDGTFGPDNLVNRAEAMKIIVNAFGIDHNGSYSAIFPDIFENEWYFPYVMGGYTAGVIDGYDDGTFKPGDYVNLAEFLKIVVMSSAVALPNNIPGDVFVDVKRDDWYAPHALFAREHNIVMPDDYGYLNADQFMTRAAVAEAIYRMLIVLENNGDPYPLHKNWDLYVSNILPFKIKYDPLSWELIEYDDEVVFFRGDKEYLQFSPIRVYPNSAVIRIVLDDNENGIEAEEYFLNIKSAFPDADFREFELEGLKALEVQYPEDRIVDWYIYLENGNVLVVYTEFGDGSLGYLLSRYIWTMLSTLEFNDIDLSKPDYSSLLSEILSYVLVEGRGMEMLNKLPDKIIIKTDSIGVGTGPVDYYYSESVNHTFKYERASDVILAVREGETTSF